MFLAGDDGWDRYVQFIGIPALKEVRTLDALLNEYVGGSGAIEIESADAIPKALGSIPAPAGDRQYHLLVVDAETEKLPDDASCRLLGYDLSDETHTSSVLNCGPWHAGLAVFVPKLNRFGLLDREDALSAKQLLPTEWPGDPHAHVTVWALYEVAALN